MPLKVIHNIPCSTLIAISFPHLQKGEIQVKNKTNYYQSWDFREVWQAIHGTTYQFGRQLSSLARKISKYIQFLQI